MFRLSNVTAFNIYLWFWLFVNFPHTFTVKPELTTSSEKWSPAFSDHYFEVPFSIFITQSYLSITTLSTTVEGGRCTQVWLYAWDLKISLLRYCQLYSNSVSCVWQKPVGIRRKKCNRLSIHKLQSEYHLMFIKKLPWTLFRSQPHRRNFV